MEPWEKWAIIAVTWAVLAAALIITIYVGRRR